jgi:RNA polymerase primary sigma factor
MSGLAAYLDEIGRYPLLTPSEEINVSRRIRRMIEVEALERPLTTDEKRELRSGQRALDRLVKCNLRWVVAVAKRYRGMAKSMDIMDLIQEGSVGLISAALKFDPERGYKFSTYSHWWIRQAITRSIRVKDRTLRLPGHIADMAYTWNAKVHKMELELGRTPNKAELAEMFQVSEADVWLFMERGGHMTSLSAIVGEDDTELGEFVSDPAAQEAMEVLERDPLVGARDTLYTALSCLEADERQLLERRWGLLGYEPHTYKQLGDERGVTREAVRQRIDRAQRKLRRRLGSDMRATA